MKEFRKTVLATKNGKIVKMTNDKAFAARLVNGGFTAGTRAMEMLLVRIEREEARQAAEAVAAETRKAAAVDELTVFDWTEQQEEMYRELGKVIEILEKKEEKASEDV